MDVTSIKEKAMTAKRNRLILLIAGSVLPAGIFGCPLVLPPPEAALEGTWELVPDDTVDPRLTDWFLTFDSAGELALVEYTFVGGDTVTWSYPPGSTTSVDEDEVHISVSLLGNGFTFDGTLDSVKTPSSATGTVSATISFGDIEISEPSSEAILVKE